MLDFLPNTQTNQYSKCSLICLGLLWCRGTDADRAAALYELVAEEKNGMPIGNEHENLQAVFMILAEIATISIPEYDDVQINVHMRKRAI